MARFLCIETATKVCSVAVSVDGGVVALREDDPDQYSHAEKINLFIAEAMDSAGIGFADLDAVAVSEGPGSYTGLRIGVSTAKGFAYAHNIPIVAVGTLEALAHHAADGKTSSLFIPMLDARRMEVFAAGFDGDGNSVFGTRAEILTADSFPEASEYASVYLLGDGADKAEEWAELRGFIHLRDRRASAAHMCIPAQKKFEQEAFVDTAYFEPFYLKNFAVGKKKKNRP